MTKLDVKYNSSHQTENSFAWSIPFKKASEFSLKTSREGHPPQHLANCFEVNYLINTCFFMSSRNQVLFQTQQLKSQFIAL